MVMCLFGHKWNGCKCERCRKTRDEQHDWDLCKGICKRCGKRCIEQHDYVKCKCSRCGKKNHQYSGCVCEKCGATNHKFFGCVCRDCGEILGVEGSLYMRHRWLCIGDGMFRCTVCGKEESKDTINNSGKHNWETKMINGRCTRVCSACGFIERNDWWWQDPHTWEPLSGCRQKCVVCGVEAYAHDYKETRCDGSGAQVSLSYQECTVCGHSGCASGYGSDLEKGYIDTGESGQKQHSK